MRRSSTRAPGALTYTENAPPAAIDPAVIVTDVDVGGTITGATVAITGNYAGAQDVLALGGVHPLITAMQVGGTLTLSGTASPAAYQAALRAVTFANTSNSPSTLTRTVTFTVTDDTALSGSDTKAIQVIAGDDNPLAVNDATTVGEDSGVTLIFVLTNDTDVDGGPIAVSSVTQPANGTVSNNGTDVSYTPNANYCNNPPGTVPDTFTYTLTPGGSTATVSVTVTCAADPPNVTTVGGVLAYTENGLAASIDPGVTVTDPDAGAMITGATVAITANFAGAQDVLALGGVHPGISAGPQVGNTLTLTGTATPSAYQAALRNVTYVNTSEGPSTLARTVTFTVTDDTALSDSATRGITVAAVNDPPNALDDTGTTDEDTPLSVAAPGVLANDTDVDPGDAKTVVALNGTGTLTQTLAERRFGDDQRQRLVHVQPAGRVPGPVDRADRAGLVHVHDARCRERAGHGDGEPHDQRHLRRADRGRRFVRRDRQHGPVRRHDAAGDAGGQGDHGLGAGQ